MPKRLRNFHVPRDKAIQKEHGYFHVPRDKPVQKEHGNFRIRRDKADQKEHGTGPPYQTICILKLILKYLKCIFSI